MEPFAIHAIMRSENRVFDLRIAVRVAAHDVFPIHPIRPKALRGIGLDAFLGIEFAGFLLFHKLLPVSFPSSDSSVSVRLTVIRRSLRIIPFARN